MHLGNVKQFSAAVETAFPRPVAWAPLLLEETANKLVEILGFPLRSDQFRIRHTDILYNYEMNATFFGTNATFTRNADRMAINLNNGQQPDDVRLIIDVITRFGRQFLTQPGLPATISAVGHFDVGDEDTRNELVKPFSPSEKVLFPGALGYMPSELTALGAEPLRISIEPSFSFSGALCVRWNANLPPQADWDSTTKAMVNSFQDAAAVYGVEIALLSLKP